MVVANFGDGSRSHQRDSAWNRSASATQTVADRILDARNAVPGAYADSIVVISREGGSRSGRCGISIPSIGAPFQAKVAGDARPCLSLAWLLQGELASV